VNSMSSYCPTDLFSNNVHRMLTALLGLVHSPQNNFRVFVDGSVQDVPSHRHSHDVESPSAWHTMAELVCHVFPGAHADVSTTTALRQVLGGTDGYDSQGEHSWRIMAFLRVLAAVLQKSGILPAVSVAQALDREGIDSVHRRYAEIMDAAGCDKRKFITALTTDAANEEVCVCLARGAAAVVCFCV
jgi:hypothetical protein